MQRKRVWKPCAASNSRSLSQTPPSCPKGPNSGPHVAASPDMLARVAEGLMVEPGVRGSSISAGLPWGSKRDLAALSVEGRGLQGELGRTVGGQAALAGAPLQLTPQVGLQGRVERGPTYPRLT